MRTYSFVGLGRLASSAVLATTLVAGGLVLSPVGAVAAVPLSLSVSDPIVAGSANVGSLLTVKTGNWGTGVVLTYQWMRDGKPIAGATKKSYRLVGSDYERRVSVVVTGGSTSRSAQAVYVSGVGTFAQTSASIAGSGNVGALLTVKTGTWAEGATYTYQWLRDGQPIPNQTKKSYRLTPVDRGRFITVEVQGAARGYSPASAVTSEMWIGDLIPGYKLTGYRVDGATADCNSGFGSDILRFDSPRAAQEYLYRTEPGTGDFPVKRVTAVFDAPGATREFVVEGRTCEGALVRSIRATASSPEAARKAFWSGPYDPSAPIAAFVDVVLP